MKSTPALLALALLPTACGRSENAGNNAAAVNMATNAATREAMANAAPLPEEADAMTANDATGSPTVATDAWIGKWTAPEGLFLTIEPGAKPGSYRLTIRDTLDSQGSYIGTAKGETIAFTRSGKPEMLRAGTGKETGFKYLMDKGDCLIVSPGKEGYCR